jgi:hypothetical protein
MHYIMRILIIIATCLIGSYAFADLDTDLLREIKGWHKGDAIPARLLKFPDGNIDKGFECGLRVLGSEVGDSISQIQDTDLLTALIFDYNAQPETFNAAVSQLIKLKGITYVSILLTNKRKENPSLFSRSELAVLAQLLRSPYIAIQVALITPEGMSVDKAESVLRRMSKELNAGVVWAKVYEKYSDLYPDLRDRDTNPKITRTLICYLYDSIVSPNGFDIMTYSMAEDLPLEHLQELFRIKHGTCVLRAQGGVYLYNITSYYNDTP